MPFNCNEWEYLYSVERELENHPANKKMSSLSFWKNYVVLKRASFLNQIQNL